MTSEAPVIAVLHPGDPAAPGVWSGTPNGICRGLEATGCAVVAVDVEPGRSLSLAASGLAGLGMLPALRRAGVATGPRALRRSGSMGATVAALRSRAAASHLAGLSVDGAVQIGTGYSVSIEAPVVTFEDMTIVQACAAGYPQWTSLPARTLAARRRRQRQAYDAARACCTTTRWAAGSVVSDYDVPATKVHAVGVGRNLEPDDPPQRDWSSPRFLFIGREWERKNGPRVLRAFERLRADLPGARLDVVGRHPQLDAAGVTGHGFLRLDDGDERARLVGLLAAATAFVMPSLHEPSALAYVEAGAAGIPSVVSAAGGSRELVGDGGIAVDPLDEEAIHAAMRALADPDVAARLGAAARRRSDLFTWPLVAGRLLRALALAGHPAESLPAFI